MILALEGFAYMGCSVIIVGVQNTYSDGGTVTSSDVESCSVSKRFD